MLKLLGILILCITFVHCQDDNDGSGSGDYPVYPDPPLPTPPGGNDDCECSYEYLEDKNSGMKRSNYHKRFLILH